MNFSFAQPWMLLLLLVLPLAAWLRGRRGTRPAFVYSSVALVKEVSKSSRSRAGAFLHALRWLALALLIMALARPQKTQTETSVRASGVDIVIAIDLSGSMESEDFEIKGQRVNRLDVAKDTVAKFIGTNPLAAKERRKRRETFSSLCALCVLSRQKNQASWL